MPSKPTWFHRLPEILDVLHSMEASHLDRQAVEHLFGGGPRRAAVIDGRVGWHPRRERRGCHFAVPFQGIQPDQGRDLFADQT